MKWFASWLAAASCAACTAQVPAVDPTQLACTDDVVLASGNFPCPETHWCTADPCVARRDCVPDTDVTTMNCRARMECRIEGAMRAGCDPESRCGTAGFECRRCEPVISAELAAVRCESGIHTSTSAPPADPARCECPDGTFCVAFAESAALPPIGAAAAFPLYLLPAGTPLPVGKLGITGDTVDRRMCVRACSSELDCPGGHSCRAAAVVNASLLAGELTRSTIGVCYPDLLVTTTTQADPLACREHADCPAPGAIEPCRFAVFVIPDHPAAPGGEAWGERRAVIAQCGTEPLSNLQQFDKGCTKSSDCRSGVCFSGTCAIPCDPVNRDFCPSNRLCGDNVVLRDLPNGEVLEDRVTICGER